MGEPTQREKEAAGRSFSKIELVDWLDEGDPEKISHLYREADRTREEFMGDEVHIRGIIEFSNYCRRDCQYCGLRKSNDRLFRYRMDPEAVIQAAGEARKLDFQTIVLQSGEDPFYSAKALCALVKRIKKEFNMDISVGAIAFDLAVVPDAQGQTVELADAGHLKGVEAASNRIRFDVKVDMHGYDFRR